MGIVFREQGIEYTHWYFENKEGNKEDYKVIHPEDIHKYMTLEADSYQDVRAYDNKRQAEIKTSVNNNRLQHNSPNDIMTYKDLIDFNNNGLWE